MNVDFQNSLHPSPVQPVLILVCLLDFDVSMYILLHPTETFVIYSCHHFDLCFLLHLCVIYFFGMLVSWQSKIILETSTIILLQPFKHFDGQKYSSSVTPTFKVYFSSQNHKSNFGTKSSSRGVLKIIRTHPQHIIFVYFYWSIFCLNDGNMHI